MNEFLLISLNEIQENKNVINYRNWFDVLPVEITFKIFKFLNINDLMTCSHVCKQFKSITKSFKIENLIVSINNKPPLARKWFAQNFEQIDCTFTFFNCNLEQINLRDEFLSNIKSIYIYSPDSYYRFFDLGQCLNHFNQLEKLEITYLELDTQSQLTLTNLKIFSIHEVKNSLLILNTPELQYLRLLSNSANLRKNIEIVYPLRITWLETNEFSEIFFKFKNLEKLYCKSIYYLNDNFLHRFKKLILLSFDQNYRQFIELREQRLHEHRESLSIYFLGFKFEDLPNFNFNFNTGHLTDKNVKLFEIYHPISDDIFPFLNAIDYTELEKAFKSNLSKAKGLGKKFVNLNGILVTNDILYKQQFIDFVKECSIMSCLALIYSSSNLYADILEFVCPHIQSLKVKEHSIELFESLFKKYPNLYSISCREELNVSLEYEYRYENCQLQVIIRENLIVKKDDKDAILII